MQNIVSFSFGRTSAYLCKLIKGIDASAKFIYMDTGAEHEETYAFGKKVNEMLDLNIVCLRPKYNEYGKGTEYEEISIDDLKPDLVPWVGMLEKYGAPYKGGEFCTARMKTEAYKNYCDKHYGKNNYTTWLGMRQDEPKRLKRKENIKYLADISDFDKSDILDFWKKQPFDLAINEHLGNCVFCIKKSKGKLALAMRDAPEYYEEFKNIIASDNVRIVETRTTAIQNMYRNNMSLDDIEREYSLFSRDDIANSLRGKYDTNSCSESCDIFQGEFEFV